MKYLKKYKKFESKEILKIKDLAEIISTQFGEFADDYYKDILDSLIDAYRNKGDEGVIELFKDGTKFDIIPMGYGRYILK